MKLSELEPQFLKFDPEHPDTFGFVDQIDEADGISFLCPVCFVANSGSVGTHSIMCWQPRVPQTVYPVPGRWNFSGTGYGDLTLTAGSSSIKLDGPGCGAHFSIKNGEIV